MRIKIKGETLISISLYFMIFYLCLPISMILLNSLLIKLIMIVSVVCYIAGLIILGKWKYMASFLVLFFFTVIYWLITWREALDTAAYVYNCFAGLSFVFSGLILYNSQNYKMLKRLFWYLTVIYFMTALTSIVGLGVYPLAARELARGATYDTSLDFEAYKYAYRQMNIAGWGQVYGMLFAVPCAVMIYKKKRNLFYLIFGVILLVMLVSSQITFAVLIGLVLFVGVYVTRENNVKKILITFVFLIIGMVFLLNLKYFLTLAVNMSRTAGFDFLTEKLNDMKILLLYRNTVGDAAARSNQYQISIDTFLHNPFVGLMVSGKASSYTIGYHSEFLDWIGTFGLTGFFIIIVSFKQYFGFIKKNSVEMRKDLLVIFVGFIGVFILNPVFNSPQIFAGAFLYPVLASKYCSERSAGLLGPAVYHE